MAMAAVDARRSLPRRWPVVVPLVLFTAALVLRIIDIFVLGLGERLGEIIVSKALGFALVVAYVWWVGARLSSVGLHSRRLVPALVIGGGLTIAAFLVALCVQAAMLDDGSSLVIAAVDPKTDKAGGAGFAAFLILGNVVNAFMEEALFRGVMLTHFMQRMSFRSANLLQAALFSVWHVVWPIRAFLNDDVSAAGAVAGGASLLVGTFVAGLVYGYLFRLTGSLWAPWVGHLINNTILNLVQVEQANGDLEPATMASVVVVFALALLALLLAPATKRLGLTRLEPWGSRAVESRKRTAHD